MACCRSCTRSWCVAARCRCRTPVCSDRAGVRSRMAMRHVTRPGGSPHARTCCSARRPVRRATCTTSRPCVLVRRPCATRPRWTAVSTRSRPTRTPISCARSSIAGSGWSACRRASWSMFSPPCPASTRRTCCSPRASRRAPNTRLRSRAGSTSPSTTSRRCSAGPTSSATARCGCVWTSVMVKATTRRCAPGASRRSSGCRSRASMPSRARPVSWACASPACMRISAAASTTPRTGATCTRNWPRSLTVSARSTPSTSGVDCRCRTRLTRSRSI